MLDDGRMMLDGGWWILDGGFWIEKDKKTQRRKERRGMIKEKRLNDF